MSSSKTPKTPKRPAHRPVTIDARRVNVSLDDATIELARTMGEGNLSAGIRFAVELAAAETSVRTARFKQEFAEILKQQGGYSCYLRKPEDKA